MNSKEEATRRLKIAQRHLKEAEEDMKRKDYPEVVSHSQLSVENAAKTIISCFRIPSWTHDPGEELLDVLSELDLDKRLKEQIERLAEYAHRLAPEHSRTNYGTLTELPEELYNEKDAEESLRMAKEGVEIAKKFLDYVYPQRDRGRTG